MIPVLATQTSSSAPLHNRASPQAKSRRQGPSATSLAQHQGLAATPGRRLLLGGVLLAHLIAAWALWQSVGPRAAASKPEPIVLSLIATAPPPAAAPAPMQTRPLQSKHMASPALPMATLTSALSPQPISLSQAPAEATPPSSTALPAQVGAPPQTATPAPAPALGPRQLAPSAVRYLVEPQMSVPLLSRRLGESGVVHLRIVVDARGHLKEASLKKSAGFARLDQQALQDIRSARFAPYLENGQALEWETVALLSYELDR